MNQTKGLFAIAIALVATALGSAQQPAAPPDPLDPTRILPRNYHVEYENDWLVIVRAHYPAKTTLPNHTHAAGPIVYLYLNASDGVEFGHDDNGPPIPRPPVRPGAIRVATNALPEHHTATNKADTPSEFIRIRLKTVIPNRIARASARLSPDRMEYDHPLLRVRRISAQPGTTTRIEAKAFPMLRVAWIPDDTEWKIPERDGYRFLEKGTTEEFEVTGARPMQLVTIELRTPLEKAK